MRELNYTNLRLYAMDNFAYEAMRLDTKTSKNETAFFNPDEIFLPEVRVDTLGMGFHGRPYQQVGDGTTVVEGYASPSLYRVRDLWKAWDVRVKVLYGLLKEGYSVLISDIAVVVCHVKMSI